MSRFHVEQRCSWCDPTWMQSKDGQPVACSEHLHLLLEAEELRPSVALPPIVFSGKRKRGSA